MPTKRVRITKASDNGMFQVGDLTLIFPGGAVANRRSMTIVSAEQAEEVTVGMEYTPERARAAYSTVDAYDTLSDEELEAWYG